MAKVADVAGGGRGVGVTYVTGDVGEVETFLRV
jgi:hypothetical protein